MDKQPLGLASYFMIACVSAWVRGAAAASAAFEAEPILIKGSGSSEGVECADLNQDGKVDLISALPMSGNINFYANAGSAGKPEFADKVLLTDPLTKKPIRLHHW